MPIIPREELDRSVRRAQRLCGAAILQAMAETDTTFVQIAERLSVDERDVKAWLMAFAECTIDSEDAAASLRVASGILMAMGCQMNVQILPAPLRREATKQELTA